MTDTSASGRFWICPQCKRHVPQRIDACRCGYAKAGEAQPIDAEVVEGAAEPSRAVVHTADSQRSQVVVVPGAQPPVKKLQIVLNAQNAGWIAAIGLAAFVVFGRSGSAPPPPTVVVVTMPAAPQPQAVAEAPIADPTPVAPTDPFGSAPVESVLEPPAAAQWAAPPVPAQSPAPPDATAPDRQQELHWQMERMKVVAQLRSAVAGYQSQICAELRGGIAISNTRDARGDYVSARAAAEAFEDSGRVAGVPAGWVRIEWNEFPDVEDPSEKRQIGVLARKWNCGKLDNS